MPCCSQPTPKPYNVCSSQPAPNPTQCLDPPNQPQSWFVLPSQPKNPTMFGSFELTQRPYSVCSSQSTKNPYNVWGPSNQPKCPAVSVAPNQPPNYNVCSSQPAPNVSGCFRILEGQNLGIWVLHLIAGGFAMLSAGSSRWGRASQLLGFSQSCPLFSFLHFVGTRQGSAG